MKPSNSGYLQGCTKFITVFQQKPNVFNSFFEKQRSTIPSNSVLPAEISHMKKDHIHTLCFDKSGVMKLIKAFERSKTHGMMGSQLR